MCVRPRFKSGPFSLLFLVLVLPDAKTGSPRLLFHLFFFIPFRAARFQPQCNNTILSAGLVFSIVVNKKPEYFLRTIECCF